MGHPKNRDAAMKARHISSALPPQSACLECLCSSSQKHRLLHIAYPSSCDSRHATTFTIAAYQRHDFCDYYRGSCSSLRCLTVPPNPKGPSATTGYAGSRNALFIISLLNAADVVTDQQVSQSPSIQRNYEKKCRAPQRVHRPERV